MNLKYINMAATGMNMFDETTVSATGSTPIMTYYISGALVLFILLLGMNCYTFIARMSPDAIGIFYITADLTEHEPHHDNIFYCTGYVLHFRMCYPKGYAP